MVVSFLDVDDEPYPENDRDISFKFVVLEYLPIHPVGEINKSSNTTGFRQKRTFNRLPTTQASSLVVIPWSTHCTSTEICNQGVTAKL